MGGEYPSECFFELRSSRTRIRPQRPSANWGALRMSQFCPNVPNVTGFGETFQYAPGRYAPQRVSKVSPKPGTFGTLGHFGDILVFCYISGAYLYVNVHLYSCKLYWNIHFCGKGGAPSYFCGLSVYGDLYAERSRRVPRSRGRHCDEYLADHPEEQVQEH